jgi:hypothetical protein
MRVLGSGVAAEDRWADGRRERFPKLLDDREESAMSKEQVAPETKGVALKLLATVDLGPEIEGMAGRQLRMRMVTIEPGGVFGPIHDDKGRPGIVYILQGTIIDQRNTGWRTEERFRRWRSRSIS